MSSTPQGSTTQGGTPQGGTPQGGTPRDPAAKDPDEWVTGDEPMTGPQRSYLQTLAHEAGEPAPPAELSKAEAAKRIDDLQGRTGRGR